MEPERINCGRDVRELVFAKLLIHSTNAFVQSRQNPQVNEGQWFASLAWIVNQRMAGDKQATDRRQLRVGHKVHFQLGERKP